MEQTWKRNCLHICSILIIVVLFFTCLGLIIAYFDRGRISDSGGDGQNQWWGGNDGRCSANSYLIGDQVCDEATNNEECMFDGGDCCREDKDVKYCQDCTCRREEGLDKYVLDVNEYDIVKFGLTDTSGRQWREIMAVESVESERVCSTLCIENIQQSSVNAWMYNVTTLLCQCLRIANFCRNHFGKLAGSTLDQIPGGGILVARNRLRTLPGCSNVLLAMHGESWGHFEDYDISLEQNLNEIIDVGLDPVTGKISVKTCRGYKDNGFLQPPLFSFESIPIGGITGGLLHNSYPLMCGGYDWMLADERPYFSQCQTQTIPFIKTDMIYSRGEARSITIGSNDSTLFVVGGIIDSDFDEEKMMSTEYVRTDPDWQPQLGPSLPQTRLYNCFTKINSTFGFLNGGLEHQDEFDMPSQKTYYFFIDGTDESDAWIVGPEMIIPRWHHSCATVANPETNIVQVVVVAGKSEEYPIQLSTVEILNTFTETWSLGPSLPKALEATQLMVVNTYELLLLGGYHNWEHQDSIFYLECLNFGCGWEVLDTKLIAPRSHFQAVSLPVGSVSC